MKGVSNFRRAEHSSMAASVGVIKTGKGSVLRADSKCIPTLVLLFFDRNPRVSESPLESLESLKSASVMPSG